MSRLQTVCQENMCVGCMACMSVCPKEAISFIDSLEYMNMQIDTNRCIDCKACYNVCQVNNPLQLDSPIKWVQGWAEETRENSSSGGFASQIMLRFIGEKSYVCSCMFLDGDFQYVITNKIEDVKSFSGSKYVKSNPKGIYEKIKKILSEGNKVLFLGLPCHVGGLKKYLKGMYEKSIIYIDLVCHGTPSRIILRDYLLEKGFDINSIQSISFRKKESFDLFIDGKCIVPFNSTDRYTIGFLRGLFYTENCYNCRYATSDRVSDITLGDSWGSDLEKEQSKGISLGLCQTKRGEELLFNSGLVLKEVDLGRAIASNHQLEYASPISPQRFKFFTLFFKKKSVSKAVRRCYPKVCAKQSLKGVLIKCGLIKR